MGNNKDTVGMLFRDIHNHWRVILDKRLRPLGLSQAKWRALLHISLSREDLKQTDLAAHIGIESPTLVRLLDRLQKDGWIRRCGSPGDRRVKVIRLTKKAEGTIQCISKTARDLRDELFSDVSREELSTLVNILSKIRKKTEVIHHEEQAGKA